MGDLKRIEKRTKSKTPSGHIIFLYLNNYWQNRHTPKINICNKLSQHLCKEINTGLKKKLYKDKLIKYKKTNHGDDVYLNIHENDTVDTIFTSQILNQFVVICN